MGAESAGVWGNKPIRANKDASQPGYGTIYRTQTYHFLLESSPRNDNQMSFTIIIAIVITRVVIATHSVTMPTNEALQWQLTQFPW